jgi:peptidyl-prolyl cis-trans isomerase B (cyclophilin B)
VLLTGCGKPTTQTKDAGQNTSATLDSIPSGSAPAAPAAPGESGAEQASETAAPRANDRLHQPFNQATRQGDDPPVGSQRPADETMTGKSTGKLYSEVVRTWNEIRFTGPDGKALPISATLETDLGLIEMKLLPEIAPNHVRNFVALARAGYYDGLCFDRIHHEEDEDDPQSRLDELEAGCPIGTGEPGLDHIGYWLNPEFDDPQHPKASHEEGTVGACRGDELDSAGCRFYITLNKAPYLDGNYTVFGKVVRGLDVARTIFQKPILLDDRDLNGSRRPEKPVVIRKVTIQLGSR